MKRFIFPASPFHATVLLFLLLFLLLLHPKQTMHFCCCPISSSLRLYFRARAHSHFAFAASTSFHTICLPIHSSRTATGAAASSNSQFDCPTAGSLQSGSTTTLTLYILLCMTVSRSVEAAVNMTMSCKVLPAASQPAYCTP